MAEPPDSPKSLHIQAREGIATASGGAVEISVQKRLLLVARALLDGGHPAAAAVAAQTASEVFLERTLAELFELRKIDFLWADVGDLIPSYNIAKPDKRLRHLYSTLSDDFEITEQSFWQGLCEHVKLRNKIVHDGTDATRQQAEASYAAVDALMNHVNGVLARVRRNRRA